MQLAPTIETYPGYDASYLRKNPHHHVFVGMRKLFTELSDKGILPVSRDTLIYIQSLIPGLAHLNCTRHLGIDGSDVFDLSKAEIEGHFQNYQGVICEDSVGIGSYIIDIHDGDGNGTIVIKVKPYGLPYGMPCSLDIMNLIFSGRCVSMDAVAMSSARIMPTLMAMGQGAGVGAAMAVK